MAAVLPLAGGDRSVAFDLPAMSGLGIVLHHGIESGPQLARYGRLAEEAGYDSIWVTERYFHEETFSLLGLLAGVTQRIRLGVGVVNPFTRHPGLLAMGAATLDRLSGGRMLLGLGRSEAGVIEGRMGLDYARPRAALEEAVSLIRKLAAGDPVEHQASQFLMEGARLGVRPVQDPLPIYVSAIGPQALRHAGRIADGVVLNAYSPPEYVRYAVAEVRHAAAAAGRDPDRIEIACMLPVRLTDDPAAIWPTLKQRIVRLLDEPNVGDVLLERGGFDASILEPLRKAVASGRDATDLISDDMVEAFYVAGPEARCRERIRVYNDAGVTMPLLLPLLPDFERVADALKE